MLSTVTAINANLHICETSFQQVCHVMDHDHARWFYARHKDRSKRNGREGKCIYACDVRT